ncbi:mechanosensitive ion channel domain-containing protein [Desulforhabdus sp. TSK]|uniref:mechanosensitive ion channel domain-containing protein n=1 Tax=Desulforhabdus sp. TSK TaxID=2925014 RepID=UPI001FC7F985|nr:mechanosensitive ion channel domain-containing protein [Desulforhabdus sp. TSK]GKT09898.1 hypothetical protein DSTSK_32030 [Desulforhabdus sp. TSK]
MKRPRLLGLLLLFWLISVPCSAQESADTQTSVPQLVPKVFTREDGGAQNKEGKADIPSLPGLAEVVPRATELEQKALKAQEALAAIQDLSAFDKRLADLEHQVTQIVKKIDGMGDPANWNIYRLLDVQHLIQGEKQKLTIVLESVSTRLAELEGLRRNWENEQAFWKKWEESLKEGQTEIPSESFQKVREAIAIILQSASNTSTQLLGLQQKLTGQLDEVRKLSVPVDAALQRIRGEIFQKNAPSFFSEEFLAQFDARLWGALKEGLMAGLKMEREDLYPYAGLILLHLVAIMALTHFIKHRGWLTERTSEWRFVKEHAWAFSVFVTQALTMLFYYRPSPSWLLLTFGVVIFSASFLVSDMVPQPRLRRVLFVLASVQIVSAVLKLISLPAPLFSIYLVLICIGGIIFFLGQSRRHMGEHEGRLDVFSAGLRGAALVAAGALLALVVGYSNFSDYLIRSSVATIFFVVVGLLLFHLGNGFLELLLNHPSVTRIGFFTRFGAALESRLRNLLKAVLWVGVCLALFQLWGIHSSMGEAWEKIFQFRFAVGDLTVSLGRIVLAILFFYVVVSASWFVRAFLDGEVFPRQQIDLGARDAIKKLIHYTLLFLGIVVAVSVMGLNLTSFAFLTGALGIGVGFGLQNIVNNFVSGLMLLFERPFKVGDVVVVDNEMGTVKKIGLRSTIIETPDRSELIIPNSQFVSGKVTNWTRSSHIARVRIPLGVAYGTDIEQVLRLLKDAAGSDSRILKIPAPNALFLRFGNSALELELHCWLSDVKDTLLVTSHLCQEIDRRCREAGVEIPFPQHDLNLRSVDKDVLEGIVGMNKKKET